MRFSRLSLERYGRFADCELVFRPGLPDLHIIYGANEAGKTTSLSAVSDLLFGFPARSPYNFQFDYSLLRVGATLEDGGQRLSCRRKKGASATLLDASDGVIDEAPLSAMLKGQARDTFGLSFSLDQDALRSGGRAMVEAKNDLGRALFAAGSGLTGIADELKKLEMEADAIWASSTSQRRSFTQAQKQLSDAARAMRDAALKPKAWSDARQAAERTHAALDAARAARNAVQSELRTADRVRRLAPLVRRREEQFEALRSYEQDVDLGETREESAETIIMESEEAERARAAADQLRTEANTRLASIEADPDIMLQAEAIDQLVADAGAGDKAARDLAGLEMDLAAAKAVEDRLRREAGANADAAPPRAAAAKLRDLARKHGQIAAAAVQIDETCVGLDDRRAAAQTRLDETPDEASESLVQAVDAGRALGADLDARCETAGRREATASSTLPPLMARLAPWSGTIEELLDLSCVSDGEVEAARMELADALSAMRREEDQAQRFDHQAAAVALEIQQQGEAAAVSPEELGAAKDERTRHWLPLKGHVLTGAALPSPQDAVTAFETSLAQVDEKLELRFALADASSRLLLLEQSEAAHKLEAEQARQRAEAGLRRHTKMVETWQARLTAASLPPLAPARFSAWQTARHVAEAAYEEQCETKASRDALVAQRDASRRALAAALGRPDQGGPLAPVLAIAERRRQQIEDANQQRRQAREQLEQTHADIIKLDRRRQQLNDEAAANASSWAKALAEAGLELDILSCGAVLDLLDELREATTNEQELRRRVDSIHRDSREHLARLTAVADGCAVAPGDPAIRLRALRDRLAAARTASTLIGSLEEEKQRRSDQVDEAAAKLNAANDALAPLMTETGAADRAGLILAIERSRAKRQAINELAATERRLVEEGDGLALDGLIEAIAVSDPDQIADRIAVLGTRLAELNDDADRAATAHGDARSAFAALDTGATEAVDAAADAEQARAELEVLAEHYILKRAQAVTLKWAIEKYRERHQDPMLLRAGELFSTLTTRRYQTLRVDADGPTPRLLGLRDDGRTMVEVGAMSEGTTDQLFLALRLAALERSVAAGVTLPFLADDLFVNFDDQRAEAGFRVLAEVAKSTQVLFFTHHPHLVAIAKSVVGAELHSECALQ